MELDLELWLNKTLIERQNKLKSTFIEVLEEVGNSISNDDLKSLHYGSKGKKISKGNDLLAYPYLVLDLIRDFDNSSGMNIRVLIWFGHGCYLLLFLGKQKKISAEYLLKENFEFGLADTPWDFGELILDKKTTRTLVEILNNKGNFHVWVKKLQVPPAKNELTGALLNELRKVFELVMKH